jgi:hypothetical protein
VLAEFRGETQEGCLWLGDIVAVVQHTE